MARYLNTKQNHDMHTIMEQNKLTLCKRHFVFTAKGTMHEDYGEGSLVLVLFIHSWWSNFCLESAYWNYIYWSRRLVYFELLTNTLKKNKKKWLKVLYSHLMTKLLQLIDFKELILILDTFSRHDLLPSKSNERKESPIWLGLNNNF